MAKRHYHEAKFLRRGERLRDFVFGYHDGAVTTFAVIVALTTAGVEHGIVVLGALANIFGSGIAFTLGDYSSIKSQMSFIKTYSTNKSLTKHEKSEIKELTKQFDKPYKIAIMALFAFVLAGVVAMTPFIFVGGYNALDVSGVLVFLSVFYVGVLRARYTHGKSIRSGMEMVVIAGIAVSAAYFIGIYGLGLLAG